MVARDTSYNRFPVVSAETSTEPAMALPSEEPRSENASWEPASRLGSLSGKGRLHDVDGCRQRDADADAQQEQAWH